MILLLSDEFMFLRLVYYNLIFVGVEVVLVGLTHEMSYTTYSIRIVTSYSIRTQTADSQVPITKLQSN